MGIVHAASAKSLQSCPTLCDPMDCSLPSSSVHRDSPDKNTGVACHALLQGDLPDPGFEPMSPVAPVLQVDFFTTSTIWEAIWASQCTHLTGCMGPDISGMTLSICLCEKKGKN